MGEVSGSEGVDSGDGEFEEFGLLQYLRIGFDQLFGYCTATDVEGMGTDDP
jgi:hypothetical protein